MTSRIKTVRPLALDRIFLTDQVDIIVLGDEPPAEDGAGDAAEPDEPAADEKTGDDLVPTQDAPITEGELFWTMSTVEADPDSRR